MPKEYYLYVNGQRVKVSEQIYKVYWREKEHEKYLEQVDKKNHLLFFLSLDHDGHFVDNIVDESVDVEKIVETQMRPSQSEVLYQGSMQKKEILLNACISMMKRFVQWQSLKVLHIQP